MVDDGSTLLKSVMQEAFTESILNGLFQPDAYMKAYPKCKNNNVARAAASRLLTKVNVKARLAYKRAELAKKYAVDEERITRERVKIGFANIQDYLNEKGHLKPLSEVPRDILAAVSSVKFDGEKVEFKLCDKQEALDKLSRQLGLYAKDNSQRRELTIVDILAIVSGHRARLNRPDRPILEASVEGKADVQEQEEAERSEQGS